MSVPPTAGVAAGRSGSEGELPDAFLRDDFTPDELELLVVGRPIADA
jgi:hypothetical protein